MPREIRSDSTRIRESFDIVSRDHARVSEESLFFRRLNRLVARAIAEFIQDSQAETRIQVAFVIKAGHQRRSSSDINVVLTPKGNVRYEGMGPVESAMGERSTGGVTGDEEVILTTPGYGEELVMTRDFLTTDRKRDVVELIKELAADAIDVRVAPSAGLKFIIADQDENELSEILYYAPLQSDLRMFDLRSFPIPGDQIFNELFRHMPDEGYLRLKLEHLDPLEAGNGSPWKVMNRAVFRSLEKLGFFQAHVGAVALPGGTTTIRLLAKADGASGSPIKRNIVFQFDDPEQQSQLNTQVDLFTRDVLRGVGDAENIRCRIVFIKSEGGGTGSWR